MTKKEEIERLLHPFKACLMFEVQHQRIETDLPHTDHVGRRRGHFFLVFTLGGFKLSVLDACSVLAASGHDCRRNEAGQRWVVDDLRVRHQGVKPVAQLADVPLAVQLKEKTQGSKRGRAPVRQIGINERETVTFPVKSTSVRESC